MQTSLSKLEVMIDIDVDIHQTDKHWADYLSFFCPNAGRKEVCILTSGFQLYLAQPSRVEHSTHKVARGQSLLLVGHTQQGTQKASCLHRIIAPHHRTTISLI